LQWAALHQVFETAQEMGEYFIAGGREEAIGIHVTINGMQWV